jgi:DNA-binding NarL/FixJ family response regulator
MNVEGVMLVSSVPIQSAEGGAIPIVVAESDPLALSSLLGFLEKDADLEIIGEACDAESARSLIESRLPSVFVAELGLPGVENSQLVNSVARMRKRPKVVLLAKSMPQRRRLPETLKLAPDGLLLKKEAKDLLIPAIKSAFQGGVLFSPSIMAKLLPELSESNEIPVELTHGERELLRLLGLGLDDDTIASRMGLSQNTIHTYVSRLGNVIGEHRRSRMIVKAHQWGLVNRFDCAMEERKARALR